MHLQNLRNNLLDRERERQRQRETETDRERQTETDRDRQRERFFPWKKNSFTPLFDRFCENQSKKC